MSELEIQEALRSHIEQDILANRLGRQLEANEDLLASSLVDSLGMMRLVVFIEERFGVQVPPEDVTFETFSTIGRIAEYLGAAR